MARLFNITLLGMGVLILSNLTPAFAQHKKGGHNVGLKSHAVNFISATAGIGLSSYYGDLCNGLGCYEFRHSTSLGGYYRYNQRFTFRGEFFWTRLTGSDKKYTTPELDPRQGRNLSFRSDLYEFTVSGTYDIIKFNGNFNQRPKMLPYVHLGVGVCAFNPQAKYDGEWINLRDVKTEGKDYSRMAVTVPFGFGTRYGLSPRVNLAGEFSYRLTFTDYLDDVSTNYVDPSSFASARDRELADPGVYFKRKEGQKRGNPDKNDGYFTFNFKVEYMIAPTSQRGGSGKNINQTFDPRYKKKHIRRR